MEKSQKTYFWSAAEEFAGRKCQVSEAATKKTKLTTAETSNRARDQRKYRESHLHTLSFYIKKQSKHKTPIMSLAHVVLRSMVQGREQPENTRQRSGRRSKRRNCRRRTSRLWVAKLQLRLNLDDSQDDWLEQDEFDRMMEEYEGTDYVQQASSTCGKLSGEGKFPRMHRDR